VGALAALLTAARSSHRRRDRIIRDASSENAIMMIDSALDAERREAKPARSEPPGLPAALPADPDDHLRALFSALPLSSAAASAPSCATRSASPWSAD